MCSLIDRWSLAPGPSASKTDRAPSRTDRVLGHRLLPAKHRRLIAEPHLALILRRAIAGDLVAAANGTREGRRLIAETHFALVAGSQTASHLVASLHGFR